MQFLNCVLYALMFLYTRINKITKCTCGYPQKTRKIMTVEICFLYAPINKIMKCARGYTKNAKHLDQGEHLKFII